MPDFDLLVMPRAASDRIGPFREGVLQVRVTRPPTDGDANRAVLRLVARAIDVPITRVRLAGGVRGRRKRVSVDGIDAAELERRLIALGTD